MSTDGKKSKPTGDSLLHKIQKWWYGGESSRQKLRQTTGVYSQEEGFEKPEKPKFHWTAIVCRLPVEFFQAHLWLIVATVLAGVLILIIWHWGWGQ